MKCFSWYELIEKDLSDELSDCFSYGAGVSVGCFDGLHLGHRTLLKKLIDSCSEKKMIPCVVTFLRPLPGIKHSEDYGGDLSACEQRLELLEKLGIQIVIIVDFNEAFSKLSGSDFLRLLINKLNMKYIAEGVDFKCGYKGATDIQAIRLFCKENNVETSFVDPVYYVFGKEEGERVSSSYIRKMIQHGFLKTAKELLTKPYELYLKDYDNEWMEKNSNLIILKKKIKQVLPPCGIYHCKINDEDVCIQITENELIFPIKYKKNPMRLAFY